MAAQQTLQHLFAQHNKIFITGTDTEVGKTYCSSLIIKAMASQQQQVFPYKPIAAGTEFDHDLQCEVNEDAKSLYLACDKQFSLAQINPIAFKPPIAPHIAAQMANQPLSFEQLDQCYDKVETIAERQLIEGAGGWLLPLNDQQLLSEWVAQKGWPVVMVVSIKLGCLNHALLTAQAIQQSGCQLIGWIANFNQGESAIGRENLTYLTGKLTAPLLFEVALGQQQV